MSREDWAPTERLRFVERTVSREVVQKGTKKQPGDIVRVESVKILQQWYAPRMAEYMRDPRVGEWRDVPMVEETAP